jgi:hypothetical protein
MSPYAPEICLTTSVDFGGESHLRLMGSGDVPAYHADGKRSVLDIANAVAAEYAPLPIDLLVLYFRAFEKAGAMTVGPK